jgi:hypothetical protein
MLGFEDDMINDCRLELQLAPYAYDAFDARSRFIVSMSTIASTASLWMDTAAVQTPYASKDPMHMHMAMAIAIGY